MTSEPSAAEIYGRDFPAGALVFEEGDPGSRMYVIRSGEVRILRRLSARLREANRRIRNFLSADAMGRAVEVLRALSGPPGEYLALKRRLEWEDPGRKAP